MKQKGRDAGAELRRLSAELAHARTDRLDAQADLARESMSRRAAEADVRRRWSLYHQLAAVACGSGEEAKP